MSILRKYSKQYAFPVIDNPSVLPFTQQNISEGNDLLVTCTAVPGNPNSTTFLWTKTDNQMFRQSGTNLQISNIQRNSSGTYRCTAETTYSNGEKGTDSQDIFVNVLCMQNSFNLFYLHKAPQKRI